MDPFKPFILSATPYKGGATRNESVADQYVNKAVKLSSNENLLGSSPKALEAIQRNLHRLNEYAYHGDEAFRKALSSHFGGELSPEQFMTANSGMELLDLIVRGFLDPGLQYIISTPTFRAYRNFGNVQGATMVNVPLIRENFELDVKGILDAVNEHTRLIFLSNPNNPTGAYITSSKSDELIYNLPDHVTVVYDEVYFHYVEAKDYSRATRYVKEGKRVIGLNSFSKAYGLAGIRLGYAYSTPEMANYLNRLRRPFMINTLTMEAGIAALTDYEHIKETQKINVIQKQWMYRQFELLEIQYWKSEANFVMFRSPVSNETFIPKMLEYGVMVRPCEGFDLPGCTRVTIGRQEDNEVFIRALKKVTGR